jgi:hypothetical protein
MLRLYIVNSLVVAITVIIHYEFLYRLTLFISNIAITHKYKIIVGLFGHSSLMPLKYEFCISLLFNRTERSTRSNY